MGWVTSDIADWWDEQHRLSSEGGWGKSGLIQGALLVVTALMVADCTPGGRPVVPVVPTTYVMLGTPSLFGPRGAPGSVGLEAFSSTDGTGWTKVVAPNGPCPSAPGNPPSAACARADIAPGLSNSPTEYVAAWWSQKNDSSLPFAFDSRCFDRGSILFVSTHAPSAGPGWSTPASLVCLASGNLDPDSRPAVAWSPGARRFAVAFRDANDGSITVFRFPSGPGPTTTTISVPPVSSTTAVALTYLNSDTLVLAVGDGSAIRIMTSTNGMPFVPAGGVTALEAGSPLAATASNKLYAPYLAAGADGAILAVARRHGAGTTQQNDIVVFSTSDGLTWTRRSAAERIGGNAGIYTPAAAGVSTSAVVAFPNYPRLNTAVVAGGGTVTVPINQQTGVALAFGPTPALPSAP